MDAMSTPKKMQSPAPLSLPLASASTSVLVSARLRSESPDLEHQVGRIPHSLSSMCGFLGIVVMPVVCIETHFSWLYTLPLSKSVIFDLSTLLLSDLGAGSRSWLLGKRLQ
jgi:hypothetical protein